jgi:hypothetical protein
MRIRTRNRARTSTLMDTEHPPADISPDTSARSRRRTGTASKITGAVFCLALAGAAVAAVDGSASASPATGSAQSGSATIAGAADSEPTLFVGPCTASDVSFYYGGINQGLGSESFDVTLAAHDGIACSLSDIPAITVTGPSSQPAIPLGFGGQGATLVLRPNSPLHTTLSFSAPDIPADALQASYLHIALAGGTSQSAYFMIPGGQQIDNGGIYISSWTTGLGGGEGD